MARNKFIFENMPIDIHKLVLLIKFHGAEFISCYQNATLNHPQNSIAFSHNSYLSWKKTDTRWHKLNVDGSMKHNLLVVGGVIRTDLGQWFTGFAKFIGRGTIVLVEAWALQIGLQISSSLNIRKIEIELDCYKVYILLAQNDTTTHPLANILYNCKQLLQHLKSSNCQKFLGCRTDVLMRWQTKQK